MLNRKAVALLVLAWWIANPFVEAMYYKTELGRGAYPPNADSIAIPIARFVLSWLLLTPLVAWTVWWVLRRAPGRFSWLAFDHGRRVWSATWSVAFGLFALSELQFALASTARNHPEDVMEALIAALAAMALRAGFCAPRFEMAPTPSSHETTGKIDYRGLSES